MHKHNLILQIALFLLSAVPISATDGNNWKNYLAYQEIQDIKKGGNTLYVLASNALYSINTTDQSVTTYDKARTLTDTDILFIEWCQSVKSLLVVYNNGNMDLMDAKDNVTNLSDYYNKSLTADKTVYDVYCEGSNAYLSTGFGIVKVNMKEASIADTYNLGFRVDYCYINNGMIYAASSTAGLYLASLTDNLLDKANWKRIGDYTSKSKTIDTELLAVAQQYMPDGPKYNHFSYIYFYNNRLYTSGGGWTTGYTYEYPGCVQVFDGDLWHVYEDDFPMQFGTPYRDTNSLAIDPRNANHVFAGTTHGGIVEFLNGKFVKNYSVNDAPFHACLFRNGEEVMDYVRVDGLVYDKNGSLYMLNSGSSNVFIELTSDGEWKTHHYDALMYPNYPTVGLGILRRSICDSRGLIWFVNDHYVHPSLFCYNPDNEQLYDFNTFTNQDGTAVSILGVRCVAEDKDGNIWIGTDAGPLMLSTSQMNSTTEGYTQVKVPRNDGTNLADFLLANIDITAIAVDGGGRKWFGTKGNGLYLISEDNNTQLQHFLASNSPLLSDNIESLAINPTTGEVYIGTDKGLCSYQSDATEPVEKMNNDVTYAYPNPVTPDYTGPITVVGLTYDAEVMIATANGTLVTKGRSNGGTFTWDGCDQQGRRVASGIYMVQTSTSDGSKGTVCKIAIVN